MGEPVGRARVSLTVERCGSALCFRQAWQPRAALIWRAWPGTKSARAPHSKSIDLNSNSNSSRAARPMQVCCATRQRRTGGLAHLCAAAGARQRGVADAQCLGRPAERRGVLGELLSLRTGWGAAAEAVRRAWQRSRQQPAGCGSGGSCSKVGRQACEKPLWDEGGCQKCRLECYQLSAVLLRLPAAGFYCECHPRSVGKGIGQTEKPPFPPKHTTSRPLQGCKHRCSRWWGHPAGS